MNSYIKLITDAAEEPVSVAEQKVQCQIDTAETAYDADLTQAITAARHVIENRISRKIGEQTLELGMECWPWDSCDQRKIEFPYPPLTEILTIKYTKQNGSVITWYDSASSPLVNPGLIFEYSAQPGAVFLKFDTTWPSDILAAGFPIKIRFKAGITTLRTDTKRAVMMLAAHLFAHREAVSDTESFEVSKGLEWLYSSDVWDELH